MKMSDILKVSGFMATIIAVCFFNSLIERPFRLWGQRNKTVRTIVDAYDGIVFLGNGGGAFGYDNENKWAYAKWRQSPERTKFEKFMFWDIGLCYDATIPPENYRYPYLGPQ